MSSVCVDVLWNIYLILEKRLEDYKNNLCIPRTLSIYTHFAWEKRKDSQTALLKYYTPVWKPAEKYAG